MTSSPAIAVKIERPPAVIFDAAGTHNHVPPEPHCSRKTLSLRDGTGMDGKCGDLGLDLAACVCEVQNR